MKNMAIDIVIIWRLSIPWKVLWLSMFKELHLIGGIGAKTAHYIQWKSIRNALEDQNMTFVTSVKGKKTSIVA